MQDDNRIRTRAHEIWEREGRPDGQQQVHWDQAEREIAAEESSSPTATNADPSPTVNAPDKGGIGPAEAASASQVVEQGQGQGSRQGREISPVPIEGTSSSPTITAPEGGASPGEAVAAVKALDHLPGSKGQNGTKGGAGRHR
jgi:hypothetical protein